MRLLACGIMCVLLSLAAPAQAATEYRFQLQGCQVSFSFRDVSARNAAWSGPCPNGRADGSGVLRLSNDNVPAAVFYGKMTKGMPDLGVLEHKGAYIPYVNGQAAEDEERDDIHRAFDHGRQVALTFSAQLRKEGNRAYAKQFSAAADEMAAHMN